MLFFILNSKLALIHCCLSFSSAVSYKSLSAFCWYSPLQKDDSPQILLYSAASFASAFIVTLWWMYGAAWTKCYCTDGICY